MWTRAQGLSLDAHVQTLAIELPPASQLDPVRWRGGAWGLARLISNGLDGFTLTLPKPARLAPLAQLEPVEPLNFARCQRLDAFAIGPLILL
jgi:hypothetical protein